MTITTYTGGFYCLNCKRDMRDDEEFCKYCAYDNLSAQLAAAQERIVELEGVQAIEPDWSQAPEWANWWAKDIDGRKFWYQHEPHTTTGFWRIPRGYYLEDGNNLHADWRQSKRRRPAQEEIT